MTWLRALGRGTKEPPETSERGMVGKVKVGERKGCAYLLRLLLDENFVLRLDPYHCLVLQYDSTWRKTLSLKRFMSGTMSLSAVEASTGEAILLRRGRSAQ